MVAPGARVLVLGCLVGCSPPDPSPPDVPPLPSDTANTGITSGPDTAEPDPTADTGSSTTPTGETGDTGVDTCAEACDDGLSCTVESCDVLDRCIVTPLFDCPWPGVATPISLADVDSELTEHQSGITWNPLTRGLWLVRNAGPSGAWRLVEDGLGGWTVDTDGLGNPAEWFELGDVESITIVDPLTAPTRVHVIDEEQAAVVVFDLTVADGEPPEAQRTWDLSDWLPDDDPLGAEGLTFVPDAALVEWGFVDGAGIPRTSALGMGGLMFVAHQNGGQIYVFDLDPADDAGIVHVATFDTARIETSGLELDPATGRLYLWHGGQANDLEVARLSSSDLGGLNRRLDTEYVFDHPGTGNLEGVALMGIEDCALGGRPLFVVEDDGGDRSIELHPDWPLGCP